MKSSVGLMHGSDRLELRDLTRYYRDDVEAPRCGCSPAHGKGELKCDSCLVCGGTGSTVDCGER